MVYEWHHLSSAASIQSIPDLNWHIEGTGDFNSDGNTDLVWRNYATGDNAAWLMNGTTLSSAASIQSISDLNWRIGSTGDFNSDGNTDLVWRNYATGVNAVWLMNGTTLSSAQSIQTAPDLNWRLVGTGNFSGGGGGELTQGTLPQIELEGTGFEEIAGLSAEFLPYVGYGFNLSTTSDFDLAVGVSDNIYVRLFRDANNNNFADSGEQIAISNRSGSLPESINLRALSPGHYIVQLDIVDPTFSTSPSYQVFLNSTPANNGSASKFIAEEADLGNLSNIPITYSGFVGANDSSDFYSFNLTNTSNELNLTLTGLSGDADVRLIRDGGYEENDNGDVIARPNVVEDGEIIARSQRYGSTPEAINLESLSAGTYYVQVYQYSGESNYTLNLSSSPTISGNPSSFIAAEFDLGNLRNKPISTLGSVGANNTSDFYRFNLLTDSTLNLELTTLSADADVRLIRDANNNGIVDDNELIASSVMIGSTSESITQSLSAGTYFAQVYQYSGDTNYTLNISA